MKLLICTQTIDKNDPILGFFHRWVEEFAKHFEHIYVICLKEGEHAFPKNVTVYSLGKETGESRMKYILRFYRYLWMLRGKYNRVFVHMNPHYVVLAGLYWTCAKIPIFFWRNHARMNVMTRIAAFFAKRVMFTSQYACMSKYAHGVQMPVGIDTRVFTEDIQNSVRNNTTKKILFLGRLSPVKRVEVFVQAATHLPSEYEVHVYGDDPSKTQTYFAMLKTLAKPNVRFHAAIKNSETPDIYRSHDVYVNLTPEGSMDKTVLEAAACGALVAVANTSFATILPQISILDDTAPQSIAKKIVELTTLSDEDKKAHRTYAQKNIISNHSLEKLAQELYNYTKQA